MTEQFHIIVGDGCSSCMVCMKVCPRGNIRLSEEKPLFGDNCDFCLGCVQHCKNHVLTINDELNPDERYRNPNIKLSEIIKSNCMQMESFIIH